MADLGKPILKTALLIQLTGQSSIPFINSMYPLIGTPLLESTDYHSKTIYHSDLGNCYGYQTRFYYKENFAK